MKLTELRFNPKTPMIMHVDFNSCFASVEQQANPFLRGKPVVVAAYVSDGGCIVAPSIEAKRLGIKTGMRVKDGQGLCRDLIVLPADPNKYRAIHLGLKKIMGSYTNKLYAKSIDEFVMDLEGSPTYQLGMRNIGEEIKARIKVELGDFLTVSIGIGPNRFLAKTAASLHKPDGLVEINKDNYRDKLSGLKLVDICGIKSNTAVRLNSLGIYTMIDFLEADAQILKAAFQSVLGYYWYWRLRGYEIDDVIFVRKSYGNSYALPKPFASVEELSPILQKLVEKTGFRMRKGGFGAQGVHVSILYRDWSFWHCGARQPEPIYDSRDIYKAARHILTTSPYRKPVHTLAVSCFDLVKNLNVQLSLLDDLQKKQKLVLAVDEVNERWGRFVITPAKMLGTANYVPDRVAFGGIKELEEAVLN